MKLTSTCTLFFLIVRSLLVEATVDYELAIYLSNAPSGALAKITANHTFFATQLLSILPGYTLIDPGQSERRLTEEAEPEDAAVTFLRGGSKDRELVSTCPTYCKNGYYQKCANMGCYCSGRRRTRELTSLLSCTDALLKETLLNVELVPYCQLKLFCSITAKILAVADDGTTSPAC